MGPDLALHFFRGVASKLKIVPKASLEHQTLAPEGGESLDGKLSVCSSYSTNQECVLFRDRWPLKPMGL